MEGSAALLTQDSPLVLQSKWAESSVTGDLVGLRMPSASALQTEVVGMGSDGAAFPGHELVVAGLFPTTSVKSSLHYHKQNKIIMATQIR